MADQVPFGLRPWPTESSNRAPKSVAEFIARTNSELPGGFRGLDQQTISCRVAEKAQSSDSLEMDVDNDNEEEDEDDNEEKDPIAARTEILRQLDAAYNTAIVTLDFLSLLLTKEQPIQARITLSPSLNQMVPIGSLGSTKLHESNITTERLHHDHQVSLGLALMDIDRVHQAARASAESLKKEITKEATYWESVLSVSEAGWAICRLPNEKQTLGVKFGFTEAAGQFRNANLAPMKRNEDGNVRLDLGKLGGTSKRLCVEVVEGGAVMGKSMIGAEVPEDASLSERVLEARNTIFVQELWHELLLESRSLLSYSVVREDNDQRIVYEAPTGQTVVLSLVDTPSISEISGPLPKNSKANAISIILKLLLSYAHRQTEHLRSRPFPPHQLPKRTIKNHDLLRPIIARDIYMQAVAQTSQHIGTLVKLLHRAGFPEARFTVLASPHHTVESAMASTAKMQRITLSHAYIKCLLQPLSFTMHFVLTKGTFIAVQGRTYLSPIITTIYNLRTPDNDNINYLVPHFPSTGAIGTTQFTKQSDIRQKLNLAATLAVTHAIETVLSDKDKKFASGGAGKWSRSLDNATIIRSDKPGMEVSVSLIGEGEGDEGPMLAVQFKKGVEEEERGVTKRWGADGPVEGDVKSVVREIFKGEM